MIQRILTGVILAPAVFALVAVGPLWGIRLFFIAVAMIGASELLAMMKSHAQENEALDSRVTILATGLLTAAAGWWGILGVATAFPLTTVGILLYGLAKPGTIAHIGPRLARMFTALLYTGSLFSVLTLLTHFPGEWARWSILISFFTVWPGDTLAYFAGRTFGGPKLYPAVSPKKTWSGSVGGVIGSILGVFLLREVWLPEGALTAELCVVFGLACGVIEQAGDLCESLFKRSYNVKDSGKLLPGHGGVLDRLDGLLFAGPVIWLLGQFFFY